MNTHEEFGSYVLLKKLFEDPLGETFRAGKLGAQGMEQVVLLRVFNGQGVDTAKLWQSLSERRGVQEALKSPNIGSGVDLGQVRGVPYVAYDYISGKDLASLLTQAEQASSPIPTDHALLVAERIALGLSVGYETRVDDKRLLHGFVVPQLVMLSNEGEIRILGFEAAPGMRDVAATGDLSANFAPYLAPEVLAGAPPAKSDDVYSLGAILLQLLTGKRPPAGAAAGLVDGAVLAADGSSLPADLGNLLKRSLAPREQRLGDVVTWHKALSKLMIDGQFSPTTFNLAFFMHNLFRDEIERESKEIEAEKTLSLPRREVGAAGGAAAPGGGDAGELTEDTGVLRERYGIDEPKPAKSKKGLLIGLAAAVVAAAVGTGAYFLMFQGSAETTEPEPVVEEEPVVAQLPQETLPGEAEEAAAPVEPAGPSPEEIRAQLDQMLEEKTAAMEKNLRAQYDEKIQELQSSLEAAQEVAAERERQAAAERERQAAAPAETQQAAQEGETPAAAGPGDSGGETAAQQAAAGAQGGAGETEAAAPAREPEQKAADSSTGEAAAERQPAGAQNRPANTAPAQPRPQRVRVGDLVEPGPGVVPPKLKSMPDPRFPPFARRLNKRATVNVRVLVDENGRVARAELAGEEAGFGFDDAAMAAAKAARFEPANKDGVRVRMWTVLKINFQ